MTAAMTTSLHVEVVRHGEADGDQSSLSLSERADAARMAEGRRRRFVATRTVARRMLGEQLGLAPREVELEVAGPRPVVVVGDLATPWAVSIAHGSGLSVVALSDGPVGIDLEQRTDEAYDVAVARRALSAEEVVWIEAQSDRARAFLDCWTRKEAVAKLLGCGLDEAAPTWSAMPSSRAWWELRELDVAPGHVCWVAVPATPG